MTLQEGNLSLQLPSHAKGFRFDGESHGLSHCMKAVDFIIETPEEDFFLELKDPDHPRAHSKAVEEFQQSLKSGKLIKDLVSKFRDTFLYRWAEREDFQPPSHYFVVIAARTLEPAHLLALTDQLKRHLPLEGPRSERWNRRLAQRCAVFNMETWNKAMPAFPLSRINYTQNE